MSTERAVLSSEPAPRQAMTKGRIRTRHLVIAIGTAALIGIGVFGILAWQRVAFEHAEPDRALKQFTDVRNLLPGEPILRVDASGRVLRRTPPAGDPSPPKHLYVLAYREMERQLVRATVPFWFLRAKGPALQYSLRGTGLDLQRLGITPADLRRYGAALVLDERSANGDRLLVWTE